MSLAKKQNGELNILRFVFSIIVLIFHWNLNFNYGVFSHGNLVVEFFFVLSGLLMAKTAEVQIENTPSGIADNTWRFITRKIKSFFPYYIAVIILQIIVRDILIKGWSITHLIRELMREIPTISLTFMSLNYNSVSLYVGNTWFLSAMVISMFMLYPLLLKSYDFNAKIVFPLITLFVLGYVYYVNESILIWESWSGFCYFGILRSISEIALGVCMYEFSKYLVKKFGCYKNNSLVKCFFTIIKVICYAIVFWYMSGSGKSSENIHILLYIAIAIALSYSELGYTIPDSKISRYLSKLSLPIFIFHGFIRWTGKDLIGSGPVSPQLFWFLVVISIVASVVFMYLTDMITALFKKMISKIATKETI